MVTVKKLYDLDPYVEWMPFLNEVFNPAIRIHRHTQVGFGENIDISLIYRSKKYWRIWLGEWGWFNDQTMCASIKMKLVLVLYLELCE